MANDTYTIKDDGMGSIEYNVLVAQFGREKADELISQPYDPDEQLDDELEEIIAGAPALIDD